MSNRTAALVLALALPALARADDGLPLPVGTSRGTTAAITSRLETAIRDALASEQPATTFLRSVSLFPDANLSGEQVRTALRVAGVPAGGPIERALEGVSRITKQGAVVTIQRAAPSTLPIVDGSGKTLATIRFAGTTSYSVSKEGDALVLADVSGLEGAQGSGGAFYAIHDLRFDRDSKGAPRLVVTIRALVVPISVVVPLAGEPSATPGVVEKLGKGR